MLLKNLSNQKVDILLRLVLYTEDCVRLILGFCGPQPDAAVYKAPFSRCPDCIVIISNVIFFNPAYNLRTVPSVCLYF
jgi:hypothetical protein